MGLFGGKDDTKAKIEELKARMQGGQPQGGQYPQQPWQQQQQTYQPPQQTWQPPRQEQQAPEQRQEQRAPEPVQEPRREEYRMDYRADEETTGIIIDLGDGMSLNLPVKSHMRLDEFLRIADRVRELKRIDHPQQHY